MHVAVCSDVLSPSTLSKDGTVEGADIRSVDFPGAAHMSWQWAGCSFLLSASHVRTYHHTQICHSMRKGLSGEALETHWIGGTVAGRSSWRRKPVAGKLTSTQSTSSICPA